MTAWVSTETRLLVQGLTGREGKFHALAGRDYGTQLVAGVTPGKGGTSVEGIPVFNTVHEAVAKTGANASMVFVPPAGCADAIMEAADAGIALVVAITEGIPVNDMIRVKAFLADRPGVRLVGPNCPGVIRPSAKVKLGIMPARIHRPGKVGIVSRSGTLTYEAVDQLSRLGIGQSTCVGIGGDPIPGTSFIDMLALFEADPATRIDEAGDNLDSEKAQASETQEEIPTVVLTELEPAMMVEPSVTPTPSLPPTASLTPTSSSTPEMSSWRTNSICFSNTAASSFSNRISSSCFIYRKPRFGRSPS